MNNAYSDCIDIDITVVLSIATGNKNECQAGFSEDQWRLAGSSEK